MTRLRWILVVLGLLSVGLSFYPRAECIRGGRYGKVHVAIPEGEVRGLTILFSGTEGWRDRDQQVAGALARQGVIAVGVDSPRYLSRIAAEKASCQNLAGDAEFVSKQIQRRLGEHSYHTPLVAGFGLGGSVARKTTEQAAPNTVLGFVGSGIAATDVVSVPLCEVDPQSETPEGVGVHETLEAQTSSELVAVVLKHIPVKRVRSDSHDLSDLPLIELPTPAPTNRFAVVISGDGGWRDLDKVISESLRRDGVAVVGWDSLRYFWSKKNSVETSRALERVLSHYVEAWHAQKIMLIGYSFGANVIPFAYNQLPKRLKDRIEQVVLLGPSPTTDFQIRVSGWMGFAPDADAANLRDAIDKMPTYSMQCFYGSSETDALCPTLYDTKAQIIRTPGGHHFGGDYESLEHQILAFHAKAAGGQAGLR